MLDWSTQDPGKVIRLRMKLLAFCARYGALPPQIGTNIPTSWLEDYAKAVGELLKEENPEPRPSGRSGR